MTLLASGSQIVIRNAFGTTKFTSDDKLVYQRAVFTGFLTVGPGSPVSVALLPGLNLTSNDFPYVQIAVTSTDGNRFPYNQFNSQITLNFGLPLQFDHAQNEFKIHSYEVLTASIGTPDNTNWYVGFSYYNWARRQWWINNPSSFVGFQWRVVILSYR